MASSLLLSSERDEGEGSSYDTSSRGDDNNGSGGGANSTSATTTTKSYISEDDPFHIFRSDLTHKLSNVTSALNTYITIVTTTDTSLNIDKVRESKKQLKKYIKLAESTLIDLETTVRVVEKRRSDFTHIDDTEIYNRRQFINRGKDSIVQTKMQMQSTEIRKKLTNDEQHRRTVLDRQQQQQQQQQRQQTNGEVGGMNGNSNGYNYTNNNNNNSYTNHERTETMLIMQQQDETLHDLDLAVTRVSYMADTIHTEIESQNDMLVKLEDELIDAEEQLGVVMGKLAKLLKTKNKCQLGLILILSLVVLVLFFLVLYT
jgi:syntaxin 6